MSLNGEFLDKNGLTYLWSKLKTKFATKQDTIADLTEIRSGATAGATAVQQTEFEVDQQRQETEIGVVANAGAKNLCPYNEFTATESSAIINDQPINLSAGTYILSFKHTATTGSTAFRFLNDSTSVENFTVNNGSSGVEKRTFTLSSDVNTLRAFTSNANEYTEFMIRRAEITDDTFVPYHPTYDELVARIEALENA